MGYTSEERGKKKTGGRASVFIYLLG